MNSLTQLLLPALVATFASMQACAAEWIKVSDEMPLTVYVDFESIRGEGKFVYAWERYQYNKEQTSNTPNGKPYRAALIFGSYNCEAKTYASLRFVTFSDEQRKQLAEDLETPKEAARHKAVIPETLGFSVLEYVCKQFNRLKR